MLEFINDERKLTGSNINYHSVVVDGSIAFVGSSHGLEAVDFSNINSLTMTHLEDNQCYMNYKSYFKQEGGKKYVYTRNQGSICKFDVSNHLSMSRFSKSYTGYYEMDIAFTTNKRYIVTSSYFYEFNIGLTQHTNEVRVPGSNSGVNSIYYHNGYFFVTEQSTNDLIVLELESIAKGYFKTSGNQKIEIKGCNIEGECLTNEFFVNVKGCENGQFEFQDNSKTVCKNCTVDFQVSDPNSKTNCVCMAGYYRKRISWGIYECIACPKGFYKEEIGDFECTSCPIINFTTLFTGSTSKDDCNTCREGYICLIDTDNSSISNANAAGIVFGIFIGICCIGCVILIPVLFIIGFFIQKNSKIRINNKVEEMKVQPTSNDVNQNLDDFQMYSNISSTKDIKPIQPNNQEAKEVCFVPPEDIEQPKMSNNSQNLSVMPNFLSQNSDNSFLPNPEIQNQFYL